MSQLGGDDGGGGGGGGGGGQRSRLEFLWRLCRGLPRSFSFSLSLSLSFIRCSR